MRSLYHFLVAERLKSVSKLPINPADYVQNRSHVFLQHMDVETFQYDVGRPKKVKNWRLNKDGRQHKTAYEIPELHRSSNLAIGCLFWNKIAMSQRKKANGVCYGLSVRIDSSPFSGSSSFY
ncbi:UNVERIFIED_ORG: hypothetical protein QFZ59_001823 [Bacillus sp. B2I3]|nr:hypothetical protein [Bacillus sp. B2I3]